MRLAELSGIVMLAGAIPAHGAGKLPPCEHESRGVLPPGEWQGSFEMPVGLGGKIGEMDVRIQNRYVGKLRFLVQLDGTFDVFQAEVHAEGRSSVRIPDEDGSEEVASDGNVTTEHGTLDLVRDASMRPARPGDPVFIREFTARGDLSSELKIVVRSRDDTHSQVRRGSAPAEFTFEVTAANCESVSGDVTSNSVLKHVQRTAEQGLVITTYPKGTWKVETTPDKRVKLASYRKRLQTVLAVPMAASPGAYDAALTVWNEVAKDPVLRECFQDEYIAALGDATSRWTNEAVQQLRSARKQKISMCAAVPLRAHVIEFARKSELLGCAATDIEGVAAELNALGASFNDRLRSGEPVRSVTGNPCPAMEKDPATRAQMQKMIDDH